MLFRSGGGYQLDSEKFFDTVTFKADNAKALVESAARAGINVRLFEGAVSVSCDERTSDEIIDRLVRAWALPNATNELLGEIPHVRVWKFLTHPIFNSYHSETSMLRYLRSLSDRDLALDRTMIPLGSCTMKLNATTEMEAITWSEFADLHPFAPASQSAGTRELIRQLSQWQIGRAHV